jgi:hypothetical protein
MHDDAVTDAAGGERARSADPDVAASAAPTLAHTSAR